MTGLDRKLREDPPRALTITWSDELKPSPDELVALLRRLGELLPDPLGERVDLEAYAAKILARAEIAFARSGGRTVGIAVIYANDLESRAGYLSFLAVTPEAQGGGTGRALLSRALARARQRGMMRFELNVVESNARARELYRRSGFRVVYSAGGKLKMRCALPAVRRALPPTPIDEANRLLAEFEIDLDLRVKRDDLYPLVGGGSKARKIQYVLSDLIAGGHDVLVTNGGPESNHARAAAVACGELGIDCHVIVVADEALPEDARGNYLLMRDSGATIEHCRRPDLAICMDQAMARLIEAGRKPYYGWGGGHGVPGTAAFAAAAAEARQQCGSWQPEFVVVASGTGSTQAGLAVGYAGTPTRVVGVSVARERDRGAAAVRECVEAYLASPAAGDEPSAQVTIDFRDDWVDGGHGGTSPELFWLIERAARVGLFVDPLYCGKALRGLVEMARAGQIDRGSRVLFWHSGSVLNLRQRRAEESAK